MTRLLETALVSLVAAGLAIGALLLLVDVLHEVLAMIVVALGTV